MTYNTIVFDLDGTLLNTLEDIHDGVNYALNQLGYPAAPLKKVRESVGNGSMVLINKVVPAGTSKEDCVTCHTIYSEYYNSHNRIKTRPYDGVPELLAALKDRGIKLAVVSNKFDASVKALCLDYFRETIQVAIGEAPGVAKKPAPDSVFTALSQLNSRKEEALYVGDSDVDIHTARNAGMKCISVSWGFRSRGFLEKEGADRIIDRPEELLAFLDQKGAFFL